MNIEHLRYVVEVDKAGSISKAAENLYMGQPTLSKTIRELERELNIILFRRTAKGTAATAQGEEFVRHAKKMLREYEEIQALTGPTEKRTQQMRISVPRASYVAAAFTDTLSELDTWHPIQLDYLETNAQRAIRHVADGRAELGIIRCKQEYVNYFCGLFKHNALEHQTLLQFQYNLLLSAQHPLAGRETIQETDLDPYIEIVHGDANMPHLGDSATESERSVTKGDKKVWVYERGSQFDMLARVPQTYMWVSPMPGDVLVRNGLVQKKCSQSAVFVDLLIYKKGRIFTPIEQRFLQHLHTTINQILRQNGVG